MIILFRPCFDDGEVGRIAAEQALNGLNAKRAAVFVDTDWNYSMEGYVVFKKYFEQCGGKISFIKQYTYNDDCSKLTNEFTGKDIDIIYIYPIHLALNRSKGSYYGGE